MLRSMTFAAAAGVCALGLLSVAVGPADAATASAPRQSAASSPCYIHNESGSTLNIRSGPGTRYTAIGTIAKGGKLPCGTDHDSVTDGQSYTSCGGGDGWMTVRINGQDGWVAEECVAVGIS